MSYWWNSIPPSEKIYWIIAFPFTALFIIQSFMTFVGIGDTTDGPDVDLNDDLDIHTDINSSSSHSFDDPSAPFKLLTIRNFIIFFTIFSWSGIVFTKSKFALLSVLIISTVLGALITILLSCILYFITRLTESGTLNLANALNCIGDVYLTIPSRRKGYGKVQITIQGALRELDALTDGEELPTGTKVIVTNIVDNQYLLVEKYI
jgi:hypothetical protein